MRSDLKRLQDVRRAIENINEFTAKGKNNFYASKLVQSAVIYQIQVIGEAVYKISDKFKAIHKEIPWAKIERTRHILVHDYFEINLDIVWNIIDKHLPILEKQIDKMLTIIPKESFNEKKRRNN